MGIQTADYEKMQFLPTLEQNIALFTSIFSKDAIFKTRKISVKSTGENVAALYMDGMADSGTIEDSIVRPLVSIDKKHKSGNKADFLCEQILFAGEVEKTENVGKAIRALLYGDTVILIEGCETSLLINTKGWRTRGITEPEDERVLQGPREGFDEAALLNVAMIRRKLLTPDFCTELQRIGRRSETVVYICYLESLIDERVLETLKKRIAKIDMDGVLDSNYISEQIRDNKKSLFRTVGTTERPDIVAARLLEGRIAVVVDGTPMVLTLPYLFSENFQSDEDYYINYHGATVGRVLRYISFLLSLCVPAVFVALVTHHKHLLPTSFAFSVAQLRSGVPITSFTECISLILTFEILKQAGLRMPQGLGHALSIVGGLVVGQAAVDAQIISVPMLIAVALSGISGLMVPRLRDVEFYGRVVLVILASLFGLYGVMAGITVVLLRIFTLTSFGVDYTIELQKPDYKHLKDTVIRAPWLKMRTRPPITNNKIRNRTRL